MHAHTEIYVHDALYDGYPVLPTNSCAALMQGSRGVFQSTVSSNLRGALLVGYRGACTFSQPSQASSIAALFIPMQL